MQRTTGFEQLTDVELIQAAQYGDTWAREQLVGGCRPLVHALASRAADGRLGADAAVQAIVRDTLGRAEFALGTLTSPDAFRPWLVGIGVASTLAYVAGLPVQAAPAGPAAGLSGTVSWLDVEDAALAALWSLEEEGLLGRFETAAALSWSPQELALRLDVVRVRLDAARSVTTALARTPRCPALDERAAAWDGYPDAGWRDELAGHTARCGYCTTGFAAAAPAGAPQAYGAAVPGAVGRGGTDVGAAGGDGTDVGAGGWGVTYGRADGRDGTYGSADGRDVTYGSAADRFAAAGAVGAVGLEALAPTETFTAVPSGAAGHPAPAGREATVAMAGRRGTRADRRRRRQADERNRRRVVVAAGLAVVAVTGGAFTLHAGRGGDEGLLEAGRASAPDLGLPLTNDPGTLTASPSTASSSPSASASATRTPGASKSPAATPSKTPRPATTTPAPKRTTASAATTPASRPKTAPTRTPRQDSGESSVADQVVALVNAERAKAGCGPLTANATLTRAAQGHSDDMAARDFFDHTNPDGAGPGDRVTAAGYPWSTYGENIAMGQSSPEQVMESWMNSPGHRANILNCDFKEIGVGIHDAGGPYWTQVFGAR
ncbi:CAP domain-containing protein [Streptomyces sp. NBC_01268]|uniref:CAP domain-containing protein n=1 Tax=Streptomyces sp. NBC_01268 TaxID=2903806 RepID=UPI002E2FCFFB|nr:CAP domain-containing protein [Streptomyces sp. NBC_01268]